MDNRNIPILYLYFHSRILEWKGKVMTEKDFQTSFFQWRIPKQIRYILMKDMEKYGLIEIEKKTRKRKVTLNNYEFKEEGKAVDYKDGDTKKEHPYLSYNNLSL
jgi:hypothetical protein